MREDGTNTVGGGASRLAQAKLANLTGVEPKKGSLGDLKLRTSETGGGSKESLEGVVSKTAEKTGELLSTYDVSSEKKEMSIDEILKKYSFIKSSQNQVYADFSLLKETEDPNKLIYNFLLDLFNNSYTIRGIVNNISILNQIYETKFQKNTQIYLGDSIIKANIYAMSLPKNENQKQVAPEFSYSFLKCQVLDSDCFIASMYKVGLRYGFIKENLLDGIAYSLESKNLDNTNLILVKQKNPVNGTDAKLEIVSSKVQLNQTAKGVNHGNIAESKVDNFFEFVNTTFDVKAGEKLFKKIDAIKGIKGKNIRGESIGNIEGTDDVNLDELGEGLEIKEEEGIKYIVAKIDGKFNTNVSDITKITPKDISVTEGVVISGDVDNNKGDITFKKGDSVTIKGNLCEGRKISGNPDKLIIEGDVEGIINVSENTEIIIQGSMKSSSMLVHKGTGIIYVSGVVSNNALIDAKKSDITIETIEGGTIYAKDLNIHKLIKANIVSKNLKIDELTNNIKVSNDGEDDVFRRQKGANVTIISETIDIVKFDSEDTTIKFIISGRDANIKTGNNIAELKYKLENIYNDTKKYLKELDVKSSNKLIYDIQKDIISEIIRIKDILQKSLNSILATLALIRDGKSPKEILDKKLIIIKQGQDLKSIIGGLDKRKSDIEFIMDEISNLESKSNDNNFLQISEIYGDSFGEVYKYNYVSQASIYNLLYELDREKLVESKSKEYKDMLKEIFDEINKILKSIYPEMKTKFCRDTNVRFGNRNFKWTPENLKTKKEA